MAPAAALLVAALLPIATALPQNFYYQAAYQPYPAAYQHYQPAYPVAYQAFNPHVLPLPLAAQGLPHHYIPAVPTHPIYSKQAHLLQGYSYETQDIAGGHGQVIYVSGPNSQQIFQQSLKALHFAVPATPIFSVNPSNETETTPTPSTEAPLEATTESAFDAAPFPTAQDPASQLPQIEYIRAQVIPPHTRIVVGELPLLTYSILTNGITPRVNESQVNSGQSASTTEESAAQREENSTEKSEPSTTPAPSSAEIEPTSSSDVTSSSTEDASKIEKEDSGAEESESSTESVDKTDS